MPKRSDQLESEIAQRRQQIASRVQKLDQRVRDDIGDTKSAIGDGVGNLADRTRLTDQVEQRPLLAVASALGIGIALGAITDPGDRRDEAAAEHRKPAAANRPGVFGDLIGAALSSMTSTAGGAIQDEVRAAIQRLFRGDVPGRSTQDDARRNASFDAGERNGHSSPSPTAKAGP